MDKQTCPFCERKELRWRIIQETKSFLLIFDTCPVSDWHLLLVSRKHILAFGYLTKDELKEAHEIITQIADKIPSTFQHLIVFEHGNRLENMSGKPSVDHAHIHLIVTLRSLQHKLPATKKVTDLFGLKRIVKETSYYFYWDVVSPCAYYGSDCEIESQFIRRIVVEDAANNEWNWRDLHRVIDYDLIREKVVQFKEVIQQEIRHDV